MAKPTAQINCKCKHDFCSCNDCNTVKVKSPKTNTIPLCVEITILFVCCRLQHVKDNDPILRIVFAHAGDEKIPSFLVVVSMFKLHFYSTYVAMAL